jgi:hypothetical protein
MHLSRWSTISLIASAIALTACTDSVDPNEVPGAYSLTDINGRALPTYQAPTPGPTLTINSAGLTLDVGAGPAQLVQNVTQYDGTQATLTSNYVYHLKGDQLIFELSPACPINAQCLAPPTGRVTGTHQIDLVVGHLDNTPIVYHFQRITLAY